MFKYYLGLALRSLRRNTVLTTLMIVTLALGIGASITTLTVLRLLSGDPLPQKSSRLFYAQIDPYAKDGYVPGKTLPQRLMTYPDAMNLLHAHQAERQAAMALTDAKIAPLHAGEHPFFSNGVMTTADFFTMFDAPFQYGGGWTAADDESRTQVVVISDFLNDKLFGGANSVGRIIRVNEQDLRVVGVLKHWAPQPRFYAQGLGGRSYGDGDAVFLPLQTARAASMDPQNDDCWAVADTSKLETAPCIWLGFWAELSNGREVAAYRQFLSNYVQQQIALGRYYRPEVALPDLPQWLRDEKVVPDDVRLQAGLAFGFLLICVVNTIGLLLAKCLRRAQEIGVRRALGATRRAIFTQFMVEASIVGLAGGLLGLGFAELGLWCIRHQPAEYAGLAHLDVHMFLLTFLVALIASLVAGLLPSWRASLLAPGSQLKAA